MTAPESAIDTALRTCQRSALHLEMRDGYMLDDPDYLAWQEGFRHDLVDRNSWWRPWLDLIAETAGRGVAIRRARIVSEPISPYIRYEYDITFTNVVAGEQVRWLARRHATNIALPGNDFWLFDNELLLINHFSGAGDWTDVETVTDPGTVKLCIAAFEAVWSRAISHDAYQPQ